MVAACFAKGKTIIQNVGELRVKETDRIKSMTRNLRRMGAHIELQRSGRKENLIIRGSQRLRGAKLDSFGDHRTAMSMAVAALASQGPSVILDINCINKSFPTFFSRLKTITKQ
jgi:3-phosphoshikimate 1-carboxyvinyltransferase